MQELDAVEAKQVKTILAQLHPKHPARQACEQGKSLLDIARCVDAKQPGMLRALLDVQRRRAPLVHAASDRQH